MDENPTKPAPTSPAPSTEPVDIPRLYARIEGLEAKLAKLEQGLRTVAGHPSVGSAKVVDRILSDEPLPAKFCDAPPVLVPPSALNAPPAS